jgi:hypothetical protein
MKCYEIQSIHWSGETGQKQSECVVADDMQQVVDYLKSDLMDRGLQVTSIHEVAPITKILCK